MKHLPNLLTLANLVCGCIAICFVLNAQPFLSAVNGEEYWVSGVEQILYGSVFIFLAGVFDLFDGWVARALNIYSPIGPDLDSLADVVSFGVAPSMILFKMLWAAYMREPHAMDVSMWVMLPAFAIACFAALRLARFNVTSTSHTSFVGMPAPAAGIFVASLPVMNAYMPAAGAWIQNKWALYLLIAFVCWLMVSRIQFIKFIPEGFTLKQMWPQILLLSISFILLFTLGWGSLPMVFVAYILLSLLVKQSDNQEHLTLRS